MAIRGGPTKFTGSRLPPRKLVGIKWSTWWTSLAWSWASVAWCLKANGAPGLQFSVSLVLSRTLELRRIWSNCCQSPCWQLVSLLCAIFIIHLPCLCNCNLTYVVLCNLLPVYMILIYATHLLNYHAGGHFCTRVIVPNIPKHKQPNWVLQFYKKQLPIPKDKEANKVSKAESVNK